MNFKQLMRQAQQMQEQLQEKLGSMRVEGTSGGGMVRAEMSGQKELLSIKIEKEAVDPEDIDMLQDLIVAAVNEAARKVDEEMQSQLGGMAGKLPGMF
jgi:DNA-binding YbaB/EbfC family protein